MKKLLLGVLVALGVCSQGVAQTDSLYRVKIVDEMGDQSYVMTNRNIVFANETQTKGFQLSFMFNEEGFADNLMIKPVALGNCQENST